MESSGGREDQFWASGESGTLAPIVPVDHTTSHRHQSNFSMTLTTPYPSSQMQPEVAEHDSYGAPPSSAGRKTRQISRSSRAVPYSQPPPSSAGEMRRHRRDESSAYIGEFSQFVSHPESSSLRNHGVPSLSVSPANSMHSSSSSSHSHSHSRSHSQQTIDASLSQTSHFISTSRLRPNPSTAASPFNDTTPPDFSQNTGSWYDVPYQNHATSHSTDHFTQQVHPAMFQPSFNSIHLTTAQTHGMNYDHHQQPYTAPFPAQVSSHAYHPQPSAPTMYNTNQHYPQKEHIIRHGHPSSTFYPY